MLQTNFSLLFFTKLNTKAKKLCSLTFIFVDILLYLGCKDLMIRRNYFFYYSISQKAHHFDFIFHNLKIKLIIKSENKQEFTKIFTFHVKTKFCLFD